MRCVRDALSASILSPFFGSKIYGKDSKLKISVKIDVLITSVKINPKDKCVKEDANFFA